MIVEIKGIGFKNKGAYLMLIAIVEKVQQRYPHAKMVISPSLNSYEMRAKHGLYQKLYFTYKKVNVGRILSILLPGFIKNYYGLIDENEIDIVLDASGLLYTDKWGASNIKRSLKQYKRMKKNNTLIILLPQAFGPFEDSKTKSYMVKMLDHVDLLISRDLKSEEYIKEIKEMDIYTYPDFTNLININTNSKIHEKYKDKICLIPNYRMIDKTNMGGDYLKMLVKVIDYLSNKNLSLFYLVHESNDDIDLINKLNTMTKYKIPVTLEEDPLKVKSIIGNCKSVISSRFHGLVNALSQGVPSLGTSWSHKYEMLFQSYNFPEGIIKFDNSDDEIITKLKFLIDENEHQKIKMNLVDRSKVQKIETNKMWELVFNHIDSRISDV